MTSYIGDNPGPQYLALAKRAWPFFVALMVLDGLRLQQNGFVRRCWAGRMSGLRSLPGRGYDG